MPPRRRPPLPLAVLLVAFAALVTLSAATGSPAPGCTSPGSRFRRCAG
jgi:hypothetical protein